MTRCIRPPMMIVVANMCGGICVVSLSAEPAPESHTRLGNVTIQCAIGNTVSIVHVSEERQ